jgi:hypothetical protein
MNLRMALLLPVFLAAGAQAFGQTPAAPPVEVPVPPSGAPVLLDPAAGDVSHDHVVTDGGPAHEDATRWWGEAEYLLWWLKGDPVPPLVTTSPAGTPVTSAGIIGLSSTQVLFGGAELNQDSRSGARLTLGYWFDDEHKIGLEVSYFLIPQATNSFSASSPATPILARPFFAAPFPPAVPVDTSSAALVAFPGLATGSITASDRSEVFHGGELLLRQGGICGCKALDVVWGYRYLHLADDIEVGDESTRLAGATTTTPLGVLAPGSRLITTDRFRTSNDLNALEVGLIGEWRTERLVLTGFAKVAAGQDEEVVDNGGTTTIISPTGAVTSRLGGVLAQQSNSGRIGKLEYPVLADLGVQLGYRVGSGMRVFAGYEFLYLNHVLRAGQQIDQVINPALLTTPVFGTAVGTARPLERFPYSEFIAQGLTAGIEFRY